MKPAACAIDVIASHLAAHAGVLWTDLGEHPGYSRNMYREQARQLMSSVHALSDPPRGAEGSRRGSTVP